MHTVFTMDREDMLCVVHCGIFLFHVIHTTVHHKQIGVPRSYSNRLEVLGGGLLELLASMVLGLLTVDEVKTLGLNLAVDKGTSKTGEDLLGLGVVVGLA